MKVIESKKYALIKEALIRGYTPSPEEEWQELSNMAKEIVDIYNNNDLGPKGVKCWVQKKDQSQPFYDILISRVTDSGETKVAPLSDNSSYEKSKQVLEQVFDSAKNRMIGKHFFGEIEDPDKPSGGERDFRDN